MLLNSGRTDEGETPDISLVTANLNGRDYLDVFLQSVKLQDFPGSLEVIVVDNGSTDESVAFLGRHHPYVHVIANDRNVGFAGAINQGARRARGRRVAFVNNDMRLAPDWVSSVTACLDEAGPDVVCAGSRILNWDGSLADFVAAELDFTGMGRQPGFHEPVPPSPAEPEQILFACGGALLIDREVFLDAGGFDEDYFAFFEDVDLGWRLWLLGHRVVLCSRAVAYHRHHATAGRLPMHEQRVLYERNAVYSLIKNYDDDSLARLLPGALLLVFKRLAFSSGIPREDLSLAPSPARPAPPASRPRYTLRGRAVRRANRLVRKLGALAPESWGLGSFRLISTDAYARAVAMDDVIAHLPQLMGKRREIQGRRVRSDAEIFPLFGNALRPFDPTPEYAAAHRAVLESFGIDDYLRRLGAGG